MDCLRLASLRCLLVLSCGDVERNPGPPPETSPRSEVLRRFRRCIQSELVKHIYIDNKHDLPTHLYERDPPGWNKFDKETKFENICNIKTGGSQTFDKLVKLFKKDVRPIPRDILDVIVCYEKLRDSKRNPDEAKWKVALENYVSQNKSMKNKQAVIDNLDDNLFIEVLKKAAVKAKQGIIGSTDDGVNNIIVAVEQVLDAMEHKTNHTVEKSKSAGKKRQATETVTKIQQVKRNKCFSSCQYKGTGVKGKKKLKIEPGSSAKDCPGDRSNMAVPCAPISEPLFPECLADVIVPEIAQYQPVSQMKGKGKKRLSQGQYKETGVKGGKKLKRTSNKAAINIATPQEWEVQAPQQSERFINIVEPGSSIEDSQGDQSNMAGFYTNSAELRSLLECFSGSVPKTAHYQDSPPSPPYCHGIVEDSRIDNIQVSENHTVSSFLMDQENLSSAADKFGINYNWGTFSSGIPSSEHISAFSSVNNALYGHTIPQDFIPSTVLEFDTTISDSGELADIMKLLDDF